MTALRRVGGDVYLASPQPNVTKILAITQLNRIIESYPSIAEAVARVKR
jgi:anti-anti-sigma regulatory factor